MRIERILESRTLEKKNNLYKDFRNKIINSFYLERKIMMMRFGKTEQYQSRMQHIVFLVSCLESFLEELFKQAFENKLITLDKIYSEGIIKKYKIELKEIGIINKNKIKISEILADEISFQNIKNIFFLGDAVKIVQHFNTLSPPKEKFSLPKIDFKPLNSRKVILPKKEKLLTKHILDNFGLNHMLPKTEDSFISMISQIRLMIQLRHKIVHKAKLVKINEWESLTYTLAVSQFAFFIYESYKIELSENKNP
jgi:hypothetical protein